MFKVLIIQSLGHTESESESVSCLIMSDSLPTPWIVVYVHGILQVRILE